MSTLFVFIIAANHLIESINAINVQNAVRILAITLNYAFTAGGQRVISIPLQLLWFTVTLHINDELLVVNFFRFE